MQKEVRRFKVDYSLDWDYEVGIHKLRADLDAIVALGATHVEIKSGISYDCAYVAIDAIVERIETDEEFNVRVAEINIRHEENKRRELEQLEKLKSKYGM